MLKYNLWLIAAVLMLTACTNSSGPDTADNTVPTEEREIRDIIGYPGWTDSYYRDHEGNSAGGLFLTYLDGLRLEEAINEGDSVLAVTFSYAGACPDAQVELAFLGRYLPNPPFISSGLFVRAGSGSCSERVVRTLYFDFSPFTTEESFAYDGPNLEWVIRVPGDNEWFTPRQPGIPPGLALAVYMWEGR